MPYNLEGTAYLILFGSFSRLRLETTYNGPATALPRTTCTYNASFGAPVLMELNVSVLPQFLHVRTENHLAQLDEIAVLLIVDNRSRPSSLRVRTHG